MIDDNVEFATAFIGTTAVALLFWCYLHKKWRRWWWPLWSDSKKEIEEGQQRSQEELTTVVVSACPNPNCIRCQRYRQVQRTARTRMPWIVKEVKKQYPNESFKRIQSSIKNPTTKKANNNNNKYQNPTVLMVSDLPSQPVVTSKHLQTCRHFQNKIILSTIIKELSKVPNSLWSTNDSPQGSWEVLPFLNQGSWVFEICKKLPKTFDFIQSIPNLLDDCLFGNVMISKIYPGTIIEPHCGPTNIRHRLQFAIQIPMINNQQQNNKGTFFLRVDGGPPSSSTTHHLEWRHIGDYFVFDDSFVHSVSFPNEHDGVIIENNNNGNENENQSTTTNTTTTISTSSSSRIVLIVDLWHPDLTDAERILLQHLYPPFVSSSSS